MSPPKKIAKKKEAQTLFFQADEGHDNATGKPRKVTNNSVTSNEKSYERT